MWHCGLALGEERVRLMQRNIRQVRGQDLCRLPSPEDVADPDATVLYLHLSISVLLDAKALRQKPAVTKATAQSQENAPLVKDPQGISKPPLCKLRRLLTPQLSQPRSWCIYFFAGTSQTFWLLLLLTLVLLASDLDCLLESFRRLHIKPATHGRRHPGCTARAL